MIRTLLMTTLLFGHASMASSSEFNDDWKFHLENADQAEKADFDDSNWEIVSLPHHYIIEPLVIAKKPWQGTCWYRKVIKPEKALEGNKVILRFEGAQNVCDLWINGTHCGQHLGGYLPAVFDIGDKLVFGKENVIAVRLNNEDNPVTGPKPLHRLDFCLYGGLYRPASLIIKNRLHITDEILANKPASGGVFVTYPEVSTEKSTIEIKTHIANEHPKQKKFTLHARLLELDETEKAVIASREISLDAGQDEQIALQLAVDNPRLWSPKNPELYYLDVAVVEAGKTIDRKRQRIGIRRIKLETKGAVINGEKYFLRGTNRHQEYPYVGNALSDNAQYRDAVKIKEAGYDFVRLSHYPQSPAFMDACDEVGLAVMNAIMGWQYSSGSPEFNPHQQNCSRNLIRRDRNHPCVLLWELSLNEAGMGRSFIESLQNIGHEEYPGDQTYVCGWKPGFDVLIKARQAGSTNAFMKSTAPCFVSEYGDWEYYAGNAGLNQHLWKDLGRGDRSSRQLRGAGEVRLLQQATNFQEAHNENLATQATGDGLWVMYDYNRGYAKNLESSGAMDIFRLPKFGYYFYRSQRDATESYRHADTGPMVFISTYWTEESPLDVRVYSNGDQVELFLNNKSLGKQKPDQDRISTNLPHPPFTFKVPAFEAGELRAVSSVAGKKTAEHRVQTPGEANKLELQFDLSGKPFEKGGDMIFVYAKIVDQNGTVLSGSSDPVTFAIEGGKAQLIGGNPIDAEAGIATILLKSGQSAGELVVTATSGNLEARSKVDIN